MEDLGANQAVPILADDDFERATIDLVGDLATYRPKGKVVLFEGGGDTDVDVGIVQRLFPVFAKRGNLLSGGGKRRVRDLHEVLAATAEQVGMASRFFAVTDRDSAPWELPPPGTQHFTWNVYHIENYLLEPRFVRAAAESLLGDARLGEDGDVEEKLRNAAEGLVNGLVLEQLRRKLNHRLVSRIDLGGDAGTKNPASEIRPSLVGSLERLAAVGKEVAEPEWLSCEAARVKGEFDAALQDGRWREEVPGRSILKAFVGSHLEKAVKYEAFRMLIVSKMSDANFQPSGMNTVVRAIEQHEM